MCALLQIYEAGILCSVVLEPLNKMTRLFPEEGCVKSSAQGCFSACTVVSNGRHASGLSNRLIQKQKQVKTKKVEKGNVSSSPKPLSTCHSQKCQATTHEKALARESTENLSDWRQFKNKYQFGFSCFPLYPPSLRSHYVKKVSNITLNRKPERR